MDSNVQRELPPKMFQRALPATGAQRMLQGRMRQGSNGKGSFVAPPSARAKSGEMPLVWADLAEGLCAPREWGRDQPSHSQLGPSLGGSVLYRDDGVSPNYFFFASWNNILLWIV